MKKKKTTRIDALRKLRRSKRKGPKRVASRPRLAHISEGYKEPISLRAECHRAHPHERMGTECELRTKIVKLEAMLKMAKAPNHRRMIATHILAHLLGGVVVSGQKRVTEIEYSWYAKEALAAADALIYNDRHMPTKEGFQ